MSVQKATITQEASFHAEENIMKALDFAAETEVTVQILQQCNSANFAANLHDPVKLTSSFPYHTHFMWDYYLRKNEGLLHQILSLFITVYCMLQYVFFQVQKCISAILNSFLIY